MSREERRIYQIGVLVAAILIIEMVAVKTEGCGRIDAFAAPAVSVDYFTEEEATEPENGLFDANSAMPCVDAESFRRWMETYEQETSQEARPVPVRENLKALRTEESEPVPETAAAPMESPVPSLYRVNGEAIDEGLQIRLYQHLQAAGIGYWFQGALAQMYQESHCQQYAQNPNGLDKGIFQYRSTYWDWSSGDIFDIDAQMRRYAAEMAARFNAGLSMDEAISRHNTSDFVTSVNWEYVAQCKQWLPLMEAIR